MFDDLDSYMNGGLSDLPQNLSDPQFDTNLGNSSIDLDDSILNTFSSKNKKSKKNGETKAERKVMQKEEKKIVLSKTQQTALKRIDKIKAKIAIQLSDSPQLISDEEDKPLRLKSGRQRAEPKKRKQPVARGGSRRLRHFQMDSVEADYDLDGDIAPTNYNRSSNNQNYDTIVLDCDDIFKGGPSVQINRNLAESNSCMTDDNTELQVNVRVNGKLNKYTMRRYQKFTELVSKISNQASIPTDQIVLTFKDQAIATSDSPDSIGYIQGLYLKAHLTSAIDKPKSITAVPDTKDKIEIKIQTASRKKPFIVYIGKTEKLTKLAYDVAEEFGCDPDKVRLEFDGDMLNFSETPDDMELEGGEILDLFLAK